MGRPKSGVLSSFNEEISKELLSLRKLHAEWGPETLLVELQGNPRFNSMVLPSIRGIARFLKAKKLSKKYEPHSDLPVDKRFKPKTSHQLWQIDGQGNSLVDDVGPIAMLNIKDVYSKVYVASWPAEMKSMQGHPNTSDYQTTLRLGFMEFGLPKTVQTDHASVFYDNKTKSPFPTKLHLWLISLGIKQVYSRVHRPTDQGVVERSHQTIEKQVLKRTQAFQDWQTLYDYTQKRRKKLNHKIPSSATNGEPPLVAHPEAKHSGKYYQIIQEADLIKLKRVYKFLSKQTWFRIVGNNRTISLGGQVYYLSKAIAKQQLKITFKKKSKMLIFQDDKEHKIERLPIKGISKEILMGNLKILPNYQLMIPFGSKTKKINKLFEP